MMCAIDFGELQTKFGTRLGIFVTRYMSIAKWRLFHTNKKNYKLQIVSSPRNVYIQKTYLLSNLFGMFGSLSAFRFEDIANFVVAFHLYPWILPLIIYIC